MILLRKFIICSLILAGAGTFAPAQAPAVSDEEVAARESAIDLAAAFGNEGFKLRDGHWCGKLEAGKSAVVQVNLYAGNEYWFSMGSTPDAKKLAVKVYDETGRLVHDDTYQAGSKAAAGVLAKASGPFYVQVEQLEGSPSTYCLVYSYK